MMTTVPFSTNLHILVEILLSDYIHISYNTIFFQCLSVIYNSFYQIKQNWDKLMAVKRTFFRSIECLQCQIQYFCTHKFDVPSNKVFYIRMMASGWTAIKSSSSITCASLPVCLSPPPPFPLFRSCSYNMGGAWSAVIILHIGRTTKPVFVWQKERTRQSQWRLPTPEPSVNRQKRKDSLTPPNR